MSCQSILLCKESGCIQIDNSDSDLVFVYPPDPIVLGDIPHGHGQVIRLGHREAAVDDGDDVAAVVKGAGHLLVDPVLLSGVNICK